MRKIYLFAVLSLSFVVAYAGNPDRQGEAGAYELLMNPFARSAGLGSMTTANVAGAEALRINVAGLGRANATEITLANMQYLGGTDINMNALGIAAPLGNGQTFGMTIAALSFGEIQRTTVDAPEGTGATFAPSFFHIGLAYAKTFEDKISVGAGLRFISQAIDNASASGFAIDAGVQYVSGEEDEFKLGISLRNIGLGMRFSGDGIITQVQEPVDGDYLLSVTNRIAEFDLPFQLNIGTSYDIQLDAAGTSDLTIVGNFSSNAFSRDNLGGGLEFSFKDMFMLRAAYKAELGVTRDAVDAPLATGLSAGFSGVIPIGKTKEVKARKSIIIDYAFTQTIIFDNTHNIVLRLNL